jgi:hypothetical protein
MLRVSFAQGELEFREWGSKRLLEEHLAQCASSRVVVGERAGYAGQCFSITYMPVRGTQTESRIGIVSAGLGAALRPQVLLVLSEGLVFIGLNDEVAAWNPVRHMLASSLELGSPFHSFVRCPGRDAILVVHELGMHFIRPNGEVTWSYDGHEVIEDFELGNQHVRIQLADGAVVTVSLQDGQPR